MRLALVAFSHVFVVCSAVTPVWKTPVAERRFAPQRSHRQTNYYTRPEDFKIPNYNAPRSQPEPPKLYQHLPITPPGYRPNPNVYPRPLTYSQGPPRPPVYQQQPYQQNAYGGQQKYPNGWIYWNGAIVPPQAVPYLTGASSVPPQGAYGPSYVTPSFPSVRPETYTGTIPMMPSIVPEAYETSPFTTPQVSIPELKPYPPPAGLTIGPVPPPITKGWTGPSTQQYTTPRRPSVYPTTPEEFTTPYVTGPETKGPPATVPFGSTPGGPTVVPTGQGFTPSVPGIPPVIVTTPGVPGIPAITTPGIPGHGVTPGGPEIPTGPAFTPGVPPTLPSTPEIPAIPTGPTFTPGIPTIPGFTPGFPTTTTSQETIPPGGGTPPLMPPGFTEVPTQPTGPVTGPVPPGFSVPPTPEVTTFVPTPPQTFAPPRNASEFLNIRIITPAPCIGPLCAGGNVSLYKPPGGPSLVISKHASPPPPVVTRPTQPREFTTTLPPRTVQPPTGPRIFVPVGEMTTQPSLEETTFSTPIIPTAKIVIPTEVPAATTPRPFSPFSPTYRPVESTPIPPSVPTPQPTSSTYPPVPSTFPTLPPSFPTAPSMPGFSQTLPPFGTTLPPTLIPATSVPPSGTVPSSVGTTPEIPGGPGTVPSGVGTTLGGPGVPPTGSVPPEVGTPPGPGRPTLPGPGETPGIPPSPGGATTPPARETMTTSSYLPPTQPRTTPYFSSELSTTRPPYGTTPRQPPNRLRAGKVRIICKPEGIEFVATSILPFTGQIFANERKRVPACFHSFTETVMPTAFLPFNECGTRETGTGGSTQYRVQVVVVIEQKEGPSTIQSYMAQCVQQKVQYNKQTLPRRIEEALEELRLVATRLEQKALLPIVDMKIRVDDHHQPGPEVSEVDIGMPLAVHWRFANQSDAYGFHVRNCMVADTISGMQMPLIDEHGCSTDVTILAHPHYDTYHDAAASHMWAFKVPDHSSLKISCDVAICADISTNENETSCSMIPTPPFCSDLITSPTNSILYDADGAFIKHRRGIDREETQSVRAALCTSDTCVHSEMIASSKLCMEPKWLACSSGFSLVSVLLAIVINISFRFSNRAQRSNQIPRVSMQSTLL